ncbi:hypothetical protein ODJ79_33570 [Actinoplanes sp. KI2]|uniref:hypothetical protein n=1 Tax=Actinoplanes sp. KI2 TaxID=2983315 RepID=UPI0021D5F93F|nr:hypothetical protein [Actinoplanes sp. KI2]MCU7728669.1 hypothetical protein [Actinoplanes sp. KI2]
MIETTTSDHRHRAGDECGFTAADLLTAADAVDAVADDAWRRFGYPSGTTASGPVG